MRLEQGVDPDLLVRSDGHEDVPLVRRALNVDHPTLVAPNMTVIGFLGGLTESITMMSPVLAGRSAIRDPWNMGPGSVPVATNKRMKRND